jgi:hypothetical protein
MGKKIKSCRCGCSYTESEWATLKSIGLMSDGDGGQLSLRNCACGSTLAIPVVMQVTT